LVTLFVTSQTRWTECALSGRACSESDPCMVHFRWLHAREAFLAFLRETNIAELAVNHPNIDELDPGLMKQVRTAAPRA
jgi:DNA-binding IscR family transcriptional regulator